MGTIVLERETNNYWNLIKNVSMEVKLALISRLSDSIIKEMPTMTKEDSADTLIDEILINAPKDVPLTDDDILQEITAVRHTV